MKYKKLNLELGNRIKDARLNAKLTQAQLHNLTGISITQLSNYENGSRNIGIDNLAKIAKATNTTIDDIFIGSKSVKPITTASNDGEMIINCITALVDKGIIGIIQREEENEFVYDQLRFTYKVAFKSYVDIIDSFVKKLIDFENNKEDYKEPEKFKKQLMDAASSKINKLQKIIESQK